MERARPIAAWAAAALLFTLPAHAWDDVGHRVIARIAWDHMEPETRTKAVALLRAAPPDADLASAEGRPLSDLELFLRAGTWPDIVRDEDVPRRWEKYHHGKWHYINYFWEQRPGGAPRDRTDLRPEAENIVERLGHFERSLADESRSAAERAVDLAWVLHLVADLHQPLHASARVTPETPEGDQGGNLFELTEDESLHWYWDQILKRIFLRRPGESAERYVEKIAEGIERDYPEPSLMPRLLPGRYEEWARDGFRVTKESVYEGVVPGRMPSDSYRWKAYGIAKPRIALAGYRLADYLERALGDRSGVQ